MHDPLRLALWSGPRNISTAMMRSWGQRDDTVVVDEPLYAHYLATTHKPHPGREEVIAAGPTDWRDAVRLLTGPVPGGKRIFYQKHMTHHLLPGIERPWLLELTNAFLIRHPRDMLASYAKVIDAPELADTGFPQQAELFEWLWKETGRIPPVVDSADVLRDPRHTLGRLCEAVGVPFQEAMLAWPPGPRPTDGVWARHWYAEVEKTTGFRPPRPSTAAVPPHVEALYSECLEDYELLYAHRLR